MACPRPWGSFCSTVRVLPHSGFALRYSSIFSALYPVIKMVSVGLSGMVSSTIQSIMVLPPTGNRHLGRLLV